MDDSKLIRRLRNIRNEAANEPSKKSQSFLLVELDELIEEVAHEGVTNIIENDPLGLLSTKQ